MSKKNMFIDDIAVVDEDEEEEEYEEGLEGYII
jgi:hypothetical protein